MWDDIKIGEGSHGFVLLWVLPAIDTTLVV